MADLGRQAISPEVGVDMQTEATPAWAGAMECVLRISLHARQAGQNIFILEVSVAGIFELDLSNMEEAHRFVRQVAPSVLFPFARKDLASLAVSAGFQPVLLDHVDFDSMLTQVIKSQRLTRAPAPMRLDVIAAKPAAPEVLPPAVAPPAVPSEPEAVATMPADWADTSPSVLLPLMEEQPPTLPPQQPPKRRQTNRVLAVLGVATLGALVAWWMEPPARVDAPVSVAIAPTPPTAPVAVPVPVAPPEPVVPAMSAETEAAIASSKARLAEQPGEWFTLDMGTVPLSTPVNLLNGWPTDRPLFVLAAKGNNLRLVYGVFPSQADAELVQSELKHNATDKEPQAVSVVKIGSL